MFSKNVMAKISAMNTTRKMVMDFNNVVKKLQTHDALLCQVSIHQF